LVPGGAALVQGHLVPGGAALVWGHLVPGGAALVRGHLVPGGAALVRGHLVPGGAALVWGHLVPGGAALVPGHFERWINFFDVSRYRIGKPSGGLQLLTMSSNKLSSSCDKPCSSERKPFNTKTKLNSVAFSPRANHTDRAAAAGSRS